MRAKISIVETIYHYILFLVYLYFIYFYYNKINL